MIANPPFHQGRAAEPDLGAAFIVAAARILKPDGRLLMVANRQLPYEADARPPPSGREKLAEDGAYKVLHAERPQRGRRCSLTLAMLRVAATYPPHWMAAPPPGHPARRRTDLPLRRLTPRLTHAAAIRRRKLP